MILKPGQFVEFRLPADGSGFVALDLRGPKGALVDVTCTEAQFEIGGRIRSLYNGLWQTDRLILSGGRDRWRSLDRRSGRYLGVVVRKADGPVEVRRLELRSQHYPAERVGTFECSDPVLTRMWQVGAATVDAATFDLIEDCPTREKAQWLGDTYLRLFEMAYLWGDVRLSAIAIREFAEDQKADRWAHAILPSGYGGSLVDYCLLLSRWAWDHWHLSGDSGLLRDSFRGVWNSMAKAEADTGRDGFLRPRGGSCYVDYTMSRMTGSLAAVGALQAMLVSGLHSASCIAGALRCAEQADRWRQRAGSLWRRINECFWVESEGLYADGLTDRGRPNGTFSGPTQYWMLFAGIPDRDRAARVLKRLWPKEDREDMAFWSRGESPFTKFFVSEALLSRGLWRQAFAHWRGYYGSMLSHPEAQSCFEMWQRDWSPKKPVPRNSLVHPFGIGPMAHLASHVAGVRPLGDGFDCGMLWEPMPGDLKWMRARLPLVGKDFCIEVEMSRSRSGGRDLVLRRPRGLGVHAGDRHLAPGDRMIVEDLH